MDRQQLTNCLGTPIPPRETSQVYKCLPCQGFFSIYLQVCYYPNQFGGLRLLAANNRERLQQLSDCFPLLRETRLRSSRDRWNPTGRFDADDAESLQ